VLYDSLDMLTSSHERRLATIADSDRILVVQAGRVMEVKTPSKFVQHSTFRTGITAASGNNTTSETKATATSNGARQGGHNGSVTSTSKQNGTDVSTPYS
jgi:ABC-type sulfate/molybdate transport systems ATPase subunit